MSGARHDRDGWPEFFCTSEASKATIFVLVKQDRYGWPDIVVLVALREVREVPEER